MYGMRKKPPKKTTLYLPDELKKEIERMAESGGLTEAAIIRDALVEHIERRPPKPRLPLPGMTLGDPTIAERAGHLMDAFGE